MIRTSQDQPAASETGVEPEKAVAASSAEMEPDEAKQGRTDLTLLGEAFKSVEIRSVALTLLLVLAVLYTLYFARAFLLPLVLAFLLELLLSPVVRWLQQRRVPTAAGAALVLLALLGGVGFAGYQLAAPAQEWFDRAPQAVSQINAKLHELKRPVEQVSQAAEQIEDAAAVGGAPRNSEVVVRGPSLVSRVFGTTQALVAAIFEVLVLLYFLLAVGDLFLEKLIKVLPQLRDKKTAVRIAREVESSVSVYLSTVTLVNIAEGLILGLALWGLDMPAPFFWGALAALVEFVPYIGAVFMFGVLTLVALTTFDSVGHALLIPGVFLVLNVIQGNLVSPLLHSRRLTLNPVAIVVGLAFWWWIWGVPGAFVAVPLLATLKIFCDHIETLKPIGEFLGT
jgi:predicted PurR-regulated permease PerM